MVNVKDIPVVVEEEKEASDNNSTVNFEDACDSGDTEE
jgi:hypothetical protein